MTNEIKTAIKSAEKRLEDEKTSALENEIHEYLKTELNSIESLEAKIRSLETEKRVHEENIKNVKTGNLEAIEKRRQSLKQPVTWTWSSSSYNSYKFYDNYVAGFTYETPNGKVYIF